MKISWDKYETALLIDTYWKIENGNIARKDAITALSAQLRQRAINNGLEIDDIFRNENGISCRLAEIEYIFTDGDKGFKSPARLFVEITKLYNSSKNDYESLLFEALVTNKDMSNKELFEKWLSMKIGNKLVPVYVNVIDEISTFCISKKIIHTALFETTDTNIIVNSRKTVQNNKLFKVTHKKTMATVEVAIKKYYEFVCELNRINAEYSSNSIIIEENGLADKQNALLVDFSLKVDYAFTTPTKVVAFGDKEIVSNWKSVYIFIVKRLYNKHVDKMLSLKRTNINGGKGIDFGTRLQYDSMVSPKEIAPSFYVETNYSASDIVKKIKTLLCICEESYDNVVINYKKDSKELAAISIKENLCEEFKKWLKDTNYSDSIVTAYCSEIDKILNALKSANTELSKEALYNTVKLIDVETRERMIMQSAISKYLQFLSLAKKQQFKTTKIINNKDINTVKKEIPTLDPYENADMSDLATVLHKYFPNGYRYSSLLAKRRFKNLYLQENNNNLELSDEEIQNRIEYLCVIVDDMAYLTTDIVNDELKEKIFAYIQKNFENGKKTIHFESILNEFKDELFETCICNNSDMLKSYLEKVNENKFYVLYNFVALDSNVKLDSFNEIKSALIEEGMPLAYEELFAKLSHLPQSKIKFILSSNEEFIRNKSGEYFHISIVHISEDELNAISSYITNAIYNRGYLSGKELISIIREQHSELVEQNSFLTEIGLRDAIGYMLRNDYSFKGNVISSKDENIDMKKVFADFCKNSGYFSLYDLNQIKEDLGTPIYFDSVYENSLRISKERFVPKNSVNFPVSKIDEILEQFCTGDYLPLKEVSMFGSFPFIDYPWNTFLLEHYVCKYSAKFKLLSAGHNATKAVGAIVKKENDFEEFIQVLSDSLANSGYELNDKNAFDFFVESGYLARKRYANIEAVLLNAQKIRNQR